MDALNNGEKKERISPGEIRSLYSLSKSESVPYTLSIDVIKSLFILVTFINTDFVINRNINI